MKYQEFTISHINMAAIKTHNYEMARGEYMRA